MLPGVAGSNGGGRYDALSCGMRIGAVPDTYTGVFDPLGSFTQPNFLGLNLQLTYDVSPRLSLTGVLANIVNTCWGGTKAPWTSDNGNVCGYSHGRFRKRDLPSRQRLQSGGIPRLDHSAAGQVSVQPTLRTVQPRRKLDQDPVPVLRDGEHQDLTAAS